MIIGKAFKSLALALSFGHLSNAQYQFKGTDNFVNVKKGPLSKMELFEAKGNFGDTLTLFKSKTLKAEFNCVNEDSNPTNEIAITVTNPYKTDLAVAMSLEILSTGVEKSEILAPGESLNIGDMTWRGIDDDSEYRVTNNIDTGFVYMSDGSYFGLFGEETGIVIDRTGTETGFGYNCVVAGPFMSVIGHGDVLHVTQSTDQEVQKEHSVFEHEIANNQKFQKSLEQNSVLLEHLVSKGKADNYIHKKLGGYDPVDWYEAKGNFGDTLTLFKSKTLKAEFSCTEDPVPTNAIAITVTNPYKTDLAVGMDLSRQSTGVDDVEILAPGESLNIGDMTRREIGDSSVDYFVDNDIDDGVVYMSDGSYFSLFGEQTGIVIDRTGTETGFGYNCVVTGPFVGVAHYKHTLDVTKNAKMVEDLKTSEKLKHNSKYFEKKMQNYIAKYEDAIKMNNDKPYVNHYIGNTFGTYVYNARGNFGDTLTLFKSKTLKAEFNCAEDPAMAITVTNPYKTDLAVAMQLEERSTGVDSSEILAPGESLTLGNLLQWPVDDSELNNIDRGFVYMSDGSYFSMFGEETIFVVDLGTETGFGYDCAVAGPYMAGLAKHDILKSYNIGPTDEKILKTNKFFSKGKLSDKKFEKTMKKLHKSAFLKQTLK